MEWIGQVAPFAAALGCVAALIIWRTQRPNPSAPGWAWCSLVFADPLPRQITVGILRDAYMNAAIFDVSDAFMRMFGLRDDFIGQSARQLQNRLMLELIDDAFPLNDADVPLTVQQNQLVIVVGGRTYCVLPRFMRAKTQGDDVFIGVVVNLSVVRGWEYRAQPANLH